MDDSLILREDADAPTFDAKQHITALAASIVMLPSLMISSDSRSTHRPKPQSNVELQPPVHFQQHSISQPVFYSLSSDSSFFDFLFSFFSFFFRFRSPRSSAVSPSCRFRFFESGASAEGFGAASGAASWLTWAPAIVASASAVTVGAGGSSGFRDGAAVVPFSNGALKSWYSAFHFAGVTSLGLPYFYRDLV